MDPNQQQSPVAGTPIFQENQDGKNAKWLWILIVIIIIGFLALAFFKGIGPFASLRGDSSEEAASPSPESVFEVVTSSPSPETTPSPSVDKSAVKVRILNGSGQAGAASEAKDFLESKGWEVASLGNADSYDFSQTIIRIKNKFLSLATVLTSDLSTKYSVQSTAEELEATSTADVEVIIGTK